MPREYICYSDLKKSLLSKNLIALSYHREALATALDREPIHKKIRLFCDRRNFINGEYLVHGQFAHFYSDVPGRQLAKYYNPFLSGNDPALLIGVELGYGLQYLLTSSGISRIYLYERNRSLLKIALTLHDFAADILTGRLVIVPQEEVLALPWKGTRVVIPEPLLFSQNRVEYLTLGRVTQKGAFSSRRAVIFTGGLFVLECGATLFDLGWDVFEIDPTILSRERTEQLLAALAPELVLKINHLNDIEAYSQSRTVVVWEIDPTASPLQEMESETTEHLFIFTHDPKRTEEYERAGASHCEYLPLCANNQKFFPEKGSGHDRGKFGCDVSFVGSCMRKNQAELLSQLLQALQSMSMENPAWKEITTWIDRLRAHPPVVSKEINLANELRSLLRSLDLPDRIQLNGQLFRVTSPVEEFLAYLWRTQVVRATAPLNIQIWGEKGWGDEFPAQYRGMADHYLDLPKIYRGSKINLDISRIYQPAVVTMRVFDVLACGGFILADRNEALLALFKEGQDIEAYDTPEEAADKVRYYLKHGAERERIAGRGYERVLHSHTFRHRLRHILTKTGLHKN